MATLERRMTDLEKRLVPKTSLAEIILAARNQPPPLMTRERLEEMARRFRRTSLDHKVAKARLRACLYAVEGEKQ